MPEQDEPSAHKVQLPECAKGLGVLGWYFECLVESQELYFCSVLACLDVFYHKTNWNFSNLSTQ